MGVTESVAVVDFCKSEKHSHLAPCVCCWYENLHILNQRD